MKLSYQIVLERLSQLQPGAPNGVAPFIDTRRALFLARRPLAEGDGAGNVVHG